MNLNDLISAAAAKLRTVPLFAGREVLEENKGDIASKLTQAVAKTNFAVVVAWNGFEPKTHGLPGKPIIGETTLVVSVFEKPVTNRRNEGALTALDAAQQIGLELDLMKAPGMDSPLVFKRITPLQELSGGVISCDAEFKTKVSL